MEQLAGAATCRTGIVTGKSVTTFSESRFLTGRPCKAGCYIFYLYL